MAAGEGGTPGELDLDTARWLTSHAGLAAVARATRHLDEGADELAAAADLTRTVHEPARRAATLTAAVARRRARKRWPEADQLLFTREALEQASDPVVSAHRAGRLLTGAPAGCPVVDLCAGVGGDTIALARAGAALGAEVTAVDLDEARLVLLAHNAEVAGVQVAVRAEDALTVGVPPGSLLHADPARRQGERRLRRLDQYLPSVPALLAAHEDAAGWALALAPGVGFDDPLLPHDVEVEYVQLGPALLEATLWRGAPQTTGASGTQPPPQATPPDPRTGGLWVAHREPEPPSPTDRAQAGEPGEPASAPAPAQPAKAGDPADGSEGPTASATLLPAGHHLAARPVHRDRHRLPVGPIGDHLVEMAPAAVRARRHDEIGETIGAWRLARTRALLTTEGAPEPSPWYRSRAIVAVLPGRTRDVKRWLEGEGSALVADAGAVEVVLHGVTNDPQRLWRELGRPPRGPAGLRLEFIRRDEDTITVVTRSLGADG